MEHWIRIQSALLAAIISSALAVNILLRNRRNKLYVRYSLFNFNLVAWYLSDALYVYTEGGSIFLQDIRSLVAIAIPFNALRFFRTFVADRSRLTRRMFQFFVVVGLALAGLILTDIHHRTDLVLQGVYVYIFTALYCALYYIYRRYQRIESKVERTRLRYMMVSGAVAFTLALLDYLPDIGYFFFGNILTVLFLYFLFQVILKFRVLDLYEFLGRSIVMASFSAVIAVIYIALVVWWRKEIDLFLFNTLIASIVLFILFDPLRTFVEDKMNQLLFRERFAFTKHLEKLRRQIAAIIHLDVLVDVAMRHLETSRRVTHASIYLLGDYGLGYELKGHIGPIPIRRLDAVTNHPFIKRLREQPILVLENLERERRQLEEYGLLAGPGVVEELEEVISTLDQMQAGVCLALVADQQIAGFLNIKDERIREAYTSDEIRSLASVAAQATLTIENTRLFERVRERDRLAALGEMSAGLAHEIRNPLGAIKGAAQLIGTDSRENMDPEMLRIIVDETNRLNTVVSQFLDYARPAKSNPVPTDINRVLERTVDVISADNPTKCRIELNLADDLPTVASEPEQLKQVFINLAVNAMQVLGDDGTLTITTSIRKGLRGRLSVTTEEFIRIAFADDGPGISEEVLRNVFIPFYTTKEKGTGLGLAISLRIIKNLGGNIEVTSKIGKGTTFTTLIPVTDPVT
jgi:two-component system sensor histidine kinase HydH